MPKIIIESTPRAGSPRTVTLSESVPPSHLHSDHYLNQLTQRLGWALSDAEQLESEAVDPTP